MTTIIGLLGAAGSGKSTVATHLERRYGARRYSLAAPLKEMTQRAFEFTDAQMFGTQQDKEAPDPRYGGKSARWFLQRIGTEGMRHTFGEDVWVDLLLKQIALDAPVVAVVEDCRFVNEATKIRAHESGKGYIIRLESPERCSEADSTHASEAQWMTAPYDYLVKPAAMGIENLYRLIDDVACDLMLFPVRREVAL